MGAQPSMEWGAPPREKPVPRQGPHPTGQAPPQPLMKVSDDEERTQEKLRHGRTYARWPADMTAFPPVIVHVSEDRPYGSWKQERAHTPQQTHRGLIQERLLSI